MEHRFVQVDTIRRGDTEVDIYQCHECDYIVEDQDLDEAQQEPCPGHTYTVNTTRGPKVQRAEPAIEQASGLQDRRYTPVFGDIFYRFDPDQD